MKRATCCCACFIAALSLFSGCGYFSRQPPLPRRAAVESTGSEGKFAALIQETDIIYFPSESVTLHSRSDSAWKLLETLRGRGGAFAIGWDWSGSEGGRRDYLEAATKAGAEILEWRELNARSPNEAEPSLDQIVADRIAAYFRAHHNDKVLVFLRRERLGMGQGVPFLVAQKTKARQLILNPRRRPDGSARLLANR